MFLYYTPCRMSWEACPIRFVFAQLMAGKYKILGELFWGFYVFSYICIYIDLR